MYRSSIIQCLSDSRLFHGLLLPVLGSEAISMVVEPQGAVTCGSSTFAIFVDSYPFRGLLLTILGLK